MIELLKLCGFGPDEMETERCRAKEVFKRLGITNEDIGQAKQRLTKYYDTQLQGVRKMFRLYIKELLDLVLAREEGKRKIIYGFMAPVIGEIGSALMTQSRELYVSSPSNIFINGLGSLLGKLVPILEAAEKKWLKTGAVAHCGNVKTIAGLFWLDLIPKPDLLVTSGYMCETAPKTVELIHEFFNIPTYYADTCQDIASMQDPHARQVIDLAVKNLRELSKRMQGVAGVKLTDGRLLEVQGARKALGSAKLRIYKLIENCDPLPLRSTHRALIARLATSSFDMDDLPNQVDALNTLYEELQERVDQGFAAVEKGSPRVFAVLPAHDSDPRFEQLLDEVGIATVAVEGQGYLFAPDGGHTPSNPERPKDPYEVICQFMKSSMYETAKARTSILTAACKRLNVEGVLDRYHAGCRSVAGDALIIRDAITKELGIPVLLMDWENFDPRVYNHEQYKKRFEVFKTTLLDRRKTLTPA